MFNFFAASRHFVRSDAGFSLITHVGFSVLSFFSFVLLIREVSLEVVGAWTLLTSFINLARVGDLWSRGVGALLGSARGEKNVDKVASYATTTFLLSVCGYVILIALSVFAVYALSPILFPDNPVRPPSSVLCLAGVAYYLICCSGSLNSILVGLGAVRTAGFQKLAGACVFLAGVIALDGDTSLPDIFFLQIFQGVTTLLFGMAGCAAAIKLPNVVRWFNSEVFKMLMTFGSKLMSIGVLQQAIEPLTRALVNFFGGSAMVAIFELAMRIIQAISGVLSSSGPVITTMFARQLTEKMGDTDRQHLPFPTVMCNLADITLVIFILLFSTLPFLGPYLVGSQSMAVLYEFIAITLSLGIGWTFTTICAPGYYLLLGHKKTWDIFLTLVVRILSLMFVTAGLSIWLGTTGLLIGIVVSHMLSSAYLLSRAARESGYSLRHLWEARSDNFIFLLILISAITLLNFASLDNFIFVMRPEATLVTVIPFVIVFVLLHKSLNLKSIIKNFTKYRA